jgi:hypothetical protein
MKKTLNKFVLKEKDFALSGRVTIIKTNSLTGEIIETQSFPNRIMLGTYTGKDQILKRLIGDNTYTLNITHAELGTGSTTPADGNTALGAPVTREAKTTASIASNVATFQFFFPSVDLPNGSYNEFGTFIDGSASLSSGKIFNRALFGSTYTKATNEDTTVQLDITIS